MPIDPKRAEAVFLAASELADPTQRAEFLARECGSDAELRRRVAELLYAHDDESDLPAAPEAMHAKNSPPSGPVATTDYQPGAAVGAVIAGRYALVERLGEGGMGEVWVAKQAEPVKRKVALKLIKKGMDSKAVLARFEQERQALAVMDHPNIARVFDGGLTADGSPYFVMELVAGLPLNKFCDEAKLPVTDRLEIFVAVCQAVQHAHQKGLVHRDLKPANILVTMVDGKPTPKVIDFGVAKAISGKLTEETLSTQFGAVIGTLEYMSPEQAGLTTQDIDTRADIYSLGVILYELLTGLRPFDSRRLKKAALDEVIRIIKEEEPPSLASRLSTDASLPSVAALRQSGPKQLLSQIRGELDWIVHKCLEKDRNRRYETANGLARDLQRYLADEPVEARPATIVYRLRKLVRRHRTVVAAGAATMLALLAGTALAIWQAVEATAAKHDAVAAATLEEQAKIRAQAKEAEARSVLSFVQKHVLAAARPEGQKGGLGYDVTLRRALKNSVPAVNTSFRDQPLIEARVRVTLGDTFLLLGDANDALEQFTSAWTIQREHLGPNDPETLTTANSLAATYDAQGRYPEAEKLFRETLAARTAQLGVDHADSLQSMDNLATVCARRGHYPEALELRERVLALYKAKSGPTDPATLWAMNNLANSYSEAGRFEDALRLDEETLKQLEAKFGKDHTETLVCRNNLALDYAAAGHYEDGLKFQIETLRLCESKFGKDHPFTLVVKHNVAKAHADLHQYDEAVNVLNETLSLQRIKPGREHANTIQTIYSLANNYGSLNRYADALRLHREALELRKAQLGPSHRDTLYSMWGVAANLIKLDRADEAIPVIDECLRRAAGPAAEPAFSGLADERLRFFEKAKDADGCRTTAELWERLSCTDAGSYYHAARYRAVSAALFRTAASVEAARRADEQADRAMAWLHKAVTAGYKDASQMKADKDLATLRDREDFKKLVAEMEPATKPPAKP